MEKKCPKKNSMDDFRFNGVPSNLSTHCLFFVKKEKTDDSEAEVYLAHYMN